MKNNSKSPTTIIKVKLKHLHPNPYLDFDYPIEEERVKKLEDSIRQTGLWPTLICRRSKNGEGYELAFGHHRRTALLNVLSPEAEIDVIVADLSDSDMVSMLAHENDEAYNCSASQVDYAVKAVVHYFEQYPQEADKLLKPDIADDKKDHKRIRKGARLYALKLQWPLARIQESLKRIEMIEKGLVDQKAAYTMPSRFAAYNFCKVVEEMKINFEDQVKFAQQIKEKETFGKRAMIEHAMCFNYLNNQPVPYTVAYSENLFNKVISSIKTVSTKLRKFRDSTCQQAIYGGTITAEDFSPETIKAYHQAVNRLAEEVKETGDFIDVKLKQPHEELLSVKDIYEKEETEKEIEDPEDVPEDSPEEINVEDEKLARMRKRIAELREFTEKN